MTRTVAFSADGVEFFPFEEAGCFLGVSKGVQNMKPVLLSVAMLADGSPEVEPTFDGYNVVEVENFEGLDMDAVNEFFTTKIDAPKTAYQELSELGFSVWESGGNCTALRRDYEDGSYHLITMENDPSAPDGWTPDCEKVRVGLFANEEAEEPSADDFVDELWSVAATFRARK